MLRYGLFVVLVSGICVLMAALSAEAQSDCFPEVMALNEKFDAVLEGNSKVSDIGASDRSDYAKLACEAAQAMIEDTAALKMLAARARCKDNRASYTKHADDFAAIGKKWVALYCK